MIAEHERIAADADRALVTSAIAQHPGLTEDEAIDIIEYFGGFGSSEYIDRAHAARKQNG